MLFGHKILVYCTSKIYRNRFKEFIETLNDELTASNWRVLVLCTETDLLYEQQNKSGDANIFELINYDITDAILIEDEELLNEELKENIISNAHNKNIPVIVFDGHRPDTHNICFDQQGGFEKVVRHVVEKHEITNLHYIGGRKDSRQSNERQAAFEKVLKENNIPFDDSMVSYGDFWDGPTIAAVQKLIDEKRVPRAFICANDTMALATTLVLKRNGFNCPKDVIVTGFDGVESIFYNTPKITSAMCSYKHLGTEAANYILDIIENHTEPGTKNIDVSLIISESCGCEEITPSNAIELVSATTNYFNLYRTEDTRLSHLSVAIHESKNLEEVINNLHTNLLYDVFCMVKAECLDASLNPNVSLSATVYGDSMYTLLDSEHQETEGKYIETKDMVPRMEEILSNKMPLIFTPINNIEIPLGYLAFTFNNFERQNFTRVSQIATWMGNAISGYRNMQYQRHLQTKIEQMYSHDSLTHLYNRNGFLRIYQQILEDDTIDTITLAMCDLDNLKYINDNFSHNAGDTSIKVVGRALSNATEDGYFCRYGGDEIIGLYTRKIEQAELQAKVEHYINKYNSESDKPYTVSTSIGVYSSKKASFEEMFGNADKLMYTQKMSKKNRRR